MLGQDFGMLSKGPSTKGVMSGESHPGWPWRKAEMLHAASVAMPPLVHWEAEAMWGTITAFLHQLL